MEPVKGKLNEWIRSKEEQEKPKSRVTWLGIDPQITPAGVFKPGETVELTDEGVALIRGIGDSRFLINGEPVSPHGAIPETEEEKKATEEARAARIEGVKTAATIQAEIEKTHGKLAVDPATGIHISVEKVTIDDSSGKPTIGDNAFLSVPRGTPEAAVSNPIEDIEAERRAEETSAKRKGNK